MIRPTTSRIDAAVLLAVGVVWVALTAVIFNEAMNLMLEIVGPHVGAVGALVALGLLLVLAVAPIIVEMAVVMAGRNPGVSVERYAAHLRRLRLTAWAVGPWAAWPPHRGAGRALVDQLLTQVPADVWLVAVARDDAVAA